MANAYVFDALCGAGHDFPIGTGSNLTMLAYAYDNVSGLPIVGMWLAIGFDNGSPQESIKTGADGYAIWTYSSALPISGSQITNHYLYSNGFGATPVGLSQQGPAYPVTWFHSTSPADIWSPAPESILTAQRGDGNGLLEWTPGSKCDARGFIEGYDLYRSTSSPVPINTPNVPLVTNLNALTYLDTGLSNAQDYFYKVVPRWKLPGNLTIRGFSNEAKLTARHEAWGMLRKHRL